MPDDIDSQPADGELEASGPSQTPSDTPPAEQPEQTDQEAASTEESVESVDSAAPSQEASPADEAGDEPVELPDFATSAAAAVENQIDLHHDVELAVKIELGRTEMYIEDVLRLGVGSVVELDKLAGDPVDIWVNSRLVARGEVLVLNDNFCVRVNEILSPIAEAESD